MELDHVGIAVKDLDKAVERYLKDFGCTVELREILADQKVELVFLKLENTKIELLTPAEDSGPLAKFLQERGEGLHHLCYKVKDIAQELARFKSKGYRLVDDTPRRGAHGSLIAFIHPKGVDGVLTELCQY